MYTYSRRSVPIGVPSRTLERGTEPRDGAAKSPACKWGQDKHLLLQKSHESHNCAIFISIQFVSLVSLSERDSGTASHIYVYLHVY